MSYMQEVDAWLTQVLTTLESGESEAHWLERVKPQIKAKLLESYRNGQKAGPSRPVSSERRPEQRRR